MALHVLATLHTDRLASCLASMGPDDYLLLLGDGVYLLQTAEILASCQASSRQVLVLTDDLRCRLPNAQPPVPTITYEQWVELSISAGPVVSWY
ncbi:MAG TPA: sulfurtransferase complex subunit TusB [Cellvibrionaceae bacterium]|nr:sulfurtransferase complex subunit TusB [Cellvibrionaceae bacterium]